MTDLTRTPEVNLISQIRKTCHVGSYSLFAVKRDTATMEMLKPSWFRLSSIYPGCSELSHQIQVGNSPDMVHVLPQNVAWKHIFHHPT